MTMRHRSSGSRATMGVRAALAVLLAAVMLPVGAVPAMGAADDDIPGVPIMASPIVGTLDEDTDFDDVFSVYLNAGQSITAALKGPGDADFDLYLYPPGSTDMAAPIDGSTWKGSVELLNYTAETSGVYYLEVYAYDGSGSYTMTWRIENEQPGLAVFPIEGVGRIETAIAASREVFTEGSEYVIIATARSFPDALGGGALSGILGAPILLTEPGALPDAVATEIDHLEASKAIILGGRSAVSSAVEEELRSLPSIVDVDRIGGSTRYETAQLTGERVVEELGLKYGPAPAEGYLAFVATGTSFPDALAASSWAAWGEIPLFLVGPATDPAAFAQMLDRTTIGGALILGGPLVVSEQIENAIDDSGIVVVDRLAGLGRYDTAAAIARQYGHEGEVAVTTGTKFPDALAGGAALGQWGVPILLTPPDSLHSATRGVLSEWGPELFYVDFLGGVKAVSVPTRAAIRSAITDTWGGGRSSLSVDPASGSAPLSNGGERPRSSAR